MSLSVPYDCLQPTSVWVPSVSCLSVWAPFCVLSVCVGTFCVLSVCVGAFCVLSVCVPSVFSLCLVLLSLTCYFISLHVPCVPLVFPTVSPVSPITQCHKRNILSLCPSVSPWPPNLLCFCFSVSLGLFVSLASVLSVPSRSLPSQWDPKASDLGYGRV